MGATNNASSQNTAAQQQIEQSRQQAMQMLAQWLQQNPFPLQNAKPPAPPQQMGGTVNPGAGQQFGGSSFGGPKGTTPRGKGKI